ncbi:MAG: hypothetical protein RMK45_08165 [Armatimonadota bacterium]|nr:hypothetical protein [Armatimonadota bacterium]
MTRQTQIALAVAVIVLVVLAVALLFVFGGGGAETASQPPPITDDRMGIPPTPPTPMGGVTPAPAPSAAPPTAQTARPPFTPRRDPFAPLPEELAAMQAEAFDPNRYFVLASPPEPPRVELPEPYEPQPRRRVAGVIIGATVSAILEQEGELPRIVYPGDMVGEFRVVAITADGIVLRRPKGNPREVRVPLEPPSTTPGGTAPGTGTGAGLGVPGAPSGPPQQGGVGVPGGGGGARGPAF